MKIFISSAQKEFATERRALADYLSGDPLLRRFFETFLFERDVPASDRPPDSVYLEEVRNGDLYPGLFGDDYGWHEDQGLSRYRAHRAYTGITRPAIFHTATRFHPIAQGCASRYPGNMSQRFINPDGVASSSGINAQRRTQPRWGIMCRSGFFQGSRSAATLRSVTESRWDREDTTKVCPVIATFGR